jgi:hypothetical protein
MSEPKKKKIKKSKFLQKLINMEKIPPQERKSIFRKEEK